MERREELSSLSVNFSPERAVAGGELGVDFGPLTELAGFMLRLAQLRVFEAFYAEFAGRGVTPGQIGILVAILENPGIRQGTLARALSIKRSNMAKIVRLLAGDGLICKRVPASDRRSVELSLTPAGRVLVERALPDIHVNDRVATAMLSGNERKTLMRLLRKLTGTDLSEARA
jgi:DNA-binding MarR family transcriptional regulator